MSKNKALMPSLREKKRYIAVEIISKSKIGFNMVHDALYQSMNHFMGTKTMSEAGIILFKERYNSDLQKGILRVNNKYVDDVKASLCFLRVGDKKVMARSLGVSGILKKANAKYIQA